MLPVTHGIEFTKTQVLLHTVLLVVVTLLPFVTGMGGLLYLAGALGLGAVFLDHAIRLKWKPVPGLPMRTFGYSIVWLMGIFTLLLVDHYPAPLNELFNDAHSAARTVGGCRPVSEVARPRPWARRFRSQVH